ncbi:hypothetical protein JCM1841_003252 [Sporobolomyces salmonicolor]
MPSYPVPQPGAALLLAFSAPSTSSARPTLLLLGATRLSALRTLAALEAGYRVVVGARHSSACSHLLGSPSPLASQDWDAELLHRLSQHEISHVPFALPPNASASEWAIWFAEAEGSGLLDGVTFVSLADTVLSRFRDDKSDQSEHRRTRASASAFKAEAERKKLMVNVAGHRDLSDFTFPATHRFESANPAIMSPLQIAVTTNSTLTGRFAKRIRRELVSSLAKSAGAAAEAVEELESELRQREAAVWPTVGEDCGDADAWEDELEESEDSSAAQQLADGLAIDYTARSRVIARQIVDSWPLERVASISLATLPADATPPDTPPNGFSSLCIPSRHVLSSTGSRSTSSSDLKEKILHIPGGDGLFAADERIYSEKPAAFNCLHVITLQRSRRIRVIIAGLALLALAIFTGHDKINFVAPIPKAPKPMSLIRPNPLKTEVPQLSFRDNLVEGNGYITAFPYGGMTNQLLALLKLVALGQLLDRTVILDELKGVHGEGSNVPLSTFFDLEAFSYYSNTSIVNWWDVKNITSPERAHDMLSCWGYRNERRLENYGIETHTWPVPHPFPIYWSMEASITFPGVELLTMSDHTKFLEGQRNRLYPDQTVTAPPFPDPQILCFENLFYSRPIEWRQGQVDRTYGTEELNPDGELWLKVGQHLRFNDHIHAIADELVASLLGSAQTPYIAVHLRQGDFLSLGRATNDIDKVAALYSTGVASVQEELKARTNGGSSRSKDLPVLFATDSNDAKFLGQLAELGWKYIDHTAFQTKHRHGGWYPGVLDSAILSGAQGFVGTRQSSFSYIAARRVETWKNGIARIVG